jgi:predicted AAA+ superfamily ATPase
LEDEVARRRLEDNPQGELARLYGTVVIDEVQRVPELFPVLRFLADRPANPAKFLLLGSVAPHLTQRISESLTGRVAFLEAGGFHLGEVEPQYQDALWLQGGLPPAFLKDEAESFRWRLDYLRTLIGQDLRELAQTRMTESALRRLLLFIAQSHAMPWNHSAAARVLGVDYKTIQRLVELFEGAFFLRQLPPFDRNLRKRLRKAPKLFIRDSGLLHALLTIRTLHQLRAHPLLGHSWEGFAVEQTIRALGLREEECFAYAVHSGDEMDMVVERGGKAYGFEFKHNDAPGLTPSLVGAKRDLGLAVVFVVYPGPKDYGLGDTVEAIGLRNLPGLRLRLGW